jgi:cytochrome P450
MQSTGESHKRTLELHQKYGEVVRVSPNKVSFLASDAWRGLMGYQKDRGVENLKDPLYYESMIKGMLGVGTEAHRRHRRVLGPAFSAQSMFEQEPLIRKYIDLLITKLKERSQGGVVPLNVVEWYNWTTFDIIGDLAFGEPFGCLSNASYHPWVAMIFAMVKQATILTQVLYVWPSVRFWLRVFAGKAIDETIREHQSLVKEKVAQRKELGTSRPDFMEAMLKGGAAEDDVSSTPTVRPNASYCIFSAHMKTET